MDTLPLAASTNSNAGSNSFSLPPHSSPVVDNSTTSVNHNDGVWVAPPELQNKQLSASEPDFSHLQPTRPVPNFVQPLHSRLHGEFWIDKTLYCLFFLTIQSRESSA